MPNPSDKCKNCGHPYRDHISGAAAQRLARAGLFLLVLTRTDAVRAATLRRWHTALWAGVELMAHR